MRVSRDADDHLPIGRVDLVACEKKGKDPKRIVAAASGTVRFIEDRYAEQTEMPVCKNNYVWISHANGEWTKYSHLAQHSVTKKASLQVGDSVAIGTYIGDQGDVGCASSTHLHFEVAVLRRAKPLISHLGGFALDNAHSKRNRIPRVRGVFGGTLRTGSEYVARRQHEGFKCGLSEVSLHGFLIEHFENTVDQLLNAGYEPAVLNVFNALEKVYVNLVGRPLITRGIAFHGISGRQYEKRLGQLRRRGYIPVLIDSYLQDGKVFYAGYFNKSGSDLKEYHGKSTMEHQKNLEQWMEMGFFPKCLSVLSVSDKREYSGIYQRCSEDSIAVRSQVTAEQFESVCEENALRGRRPSFVKGYNHRGRVYLAAIFNTGSQTRVRWKRDMTWEDFERENEEARESNMMTRTVTSYYDDGVRYCAWWG